MDDDLLVGVMLVAGAWQGGEVVEGAWDSWTPRHRNNARGRAAACRDLRRRAAEYGVELPAVIPTIEEC
jgi:hypothetical protein